MERELCSVQKTVEGSGARGCLLRETMCVLAWWKEGHSCLCVVCAGAMVGCSHTSFTAELVPSMPGPTKGAAVQPSDVME